MRRWHLNGSKEVDGEFHGGSKRRRTGQVRSVAATTFDLQQLQTAAIYRVANGVDLQRLRTATSNDFKMEYYIRHLDGLPIRSEAERDRVMKCLEAAIERRATEGLELEVRTEDRVGLLSDITRVLRENSLSIKRAEISTKCGKAKDTFYVTDVSGNPVEPKTIDSIRQQVGKQAVVCVRTNSFAPQKDHQETAISFLFGNLFKARTFQNLKLIRSYS